MTMDEQKAIEHRTSKYEYRGEMPAEVSVFSNDMRSVQAWLLQALRRAEADGDGVTEGTLVVVLRMLNTMQRQTVGLRPVQRKEVVRDVDGSVYGSREWTEAMLEPVERAGMSAGRPTSKTTEAIERLTDLLMDKVEREHAADLEALASRYPEA
jgi:hypothetical protein